MIAILSRIGSWLWAGALVLIGVLGIVVKVLLSSRAKWKQKAKDAEAEIAFDDDVDQMETEVEAKYSDFERVLDKERDAGAWPKNLKDADKW